MAICGICGDDGEYRGQWWSPDDGWRWAALCGGCRQDYGKVKPAPDDYAYAKRGTLDADVALADCDEL